MQDSKDWMAFLFNSLGNNSNSQISNCQPKLYSTPVSMNHSDKVEKRLLSLEKRVMELCQACKRGELVTAHQPPYNSPPSLPYPSQKMRKRDLESVCGAVFCLNPSPTYMQQMEMLHKLEEMYKDIDRKPILSLIRLWFRKKREEVSTRINTVLSNSPWLSTLIVQADSLATALNLVKESPELLQEALDKARVGITDEVACREFCLAKVENFLKKHYFKA